MESPPSGRIPPPALIKSSIGAVINKIRGLLPEAIPATISDLTEKQLFLPIPLALPPAAKIIKISEHLTLGEVMDNRSGATPLCGISPRTLEAFEWIRKALGGKPLSIASGYRTTATNAAVGGATESFHLRGRALDIIIPPRQMRAALEAAERFFGKAGGIGTYSRHIHVDDRPERARWKG